MTSARFVAVLLAGLLPAVLSQRDGDLRITPYYQGQPATRGLLEVYLSSAGRWGTICDTRSAFQWREATVACKQLGYRQYSDYWRIDSVNQTQNSLLQNVECPSSDHARLLECVDNPGSHVFSCTFGQLVALSCSECERRTCNSGVCPHESRCNDGSFVCPEEDQYDIERCRDVPTTQAPTVKVANGDLRLIRSLGVYNRDGFFAGRLEMYLSGEWGTICERSGAFSAVAADIACRQLGYRQAISYGTVQNLDNSPFYPLARDSVPIHLQDVFCHADYDTNLLYCHHNALGTISGFCSHNDDIGLNCTNCNQFLCSDGSCAWSCRDCPGEDACEATTEPPNQVVTLANQGDLRLVPAERTNGFTAGRLEIFYAGRWGTICGDSLGKTEADLACRQLGFHQARNWGSRLSRSFPPDHSTVPVWLQSSFINCRGLTDQPLLSCITSVFTTGTSSCTDMFALNCSSCSQFLCPEGTCVSQCDGSWDCSNGEDEEREACDVVAVARLYGRMDALIVFLVFLFMIILFAAVGSLVCVCRKKTHRCKGYTNVPTRIVETAAAEGDGTPPQIEMDNKDEV